jgi:GNAT superfamily N-acetyltransferase
MLPLLPAAGDVMTRNGARAPLLYRDKNRSGRQPSADSVRLEDGSLVVVRPVQTTDIPLMIDGFVRLSPNSRRLRFLIGKNALTARELRYFTDIDHRDHEALGAVDTVTGRGVGVARYIRVTDQLHCAEVAITVVDEWQRRGLGSELMARLARRALNEGIRCFRALIAADNVAVVALLRRMDADVELISYDSDTVQYEISLRCRQPCATPQSAS